MLDLKDEVVEYEITSNRPDCFSVLGIAREAAATYDIPFHYPEIKVAEKAEGKAEDFVKVTIENPTLCPRYVARVVKNVKIGHFSQMDEKKTAYGRCTPHQQHR